ncbi:hypothetical protein NY10_1092 [Carnobacterium antarcticum]|nr:hypothetical protein NY10_1092 [Carnobacterium sp. CP1]
MFYSIDKFKQFTGFKARIRTVNERSQNNRKTKSGKRKAVK